MSPRLLGEGEEAPGQDSPRAGWSQRASASTRRSAHLRGTTIGWKYTRISSRLDRLLERRRELVTAPDARVHSRLETSRSDAFRPPSRCTSRRPHWTAARRRSARRSQPTRCRRLHGRASRRPFRKNGVASLRHDPRRDVLRHVFAADVQEDAELVTAQARGEIARTDACAHPFGDGEEELVTGAVTESVVDRLEVVEVDEQDSAPSQDATPVQSRRVRRRECGWAAR